MNANTHAQALAVDMQCLNEDAQDQGVEQGESKQKPCVVHKQILLCYCQMLPAPGF